MQTQVTRWLSNYIYKHPKVVEWMNTRIREFLHRHCFLGVTVFMFCAVALLIIGHFFNLLLLPIMAECLMNTRLQRLLHSDPLLGVPLFLFVIVAALVMGYYLIYPLLPILLILWLCVINEGLHAIRNLIDEFVIYAGLSVLAYLHIWLFMKVYGWINSSNQAAHP